MVVGVGATGCGIAEVLVRAGVGTVRVIDRDVIELGNLHRHVKGGVFVYVNRHDRALAISDMTKLNPDRLGEDGPQFPQYLPGTVEVVDVTKRVDRSADRTGHQYYKQDSWVLDDMAKHINRGIEP